MSQPESQIQPEIPDYRTPHTETKSQEPESARLGPPQRLIGVLLSPGETFQDVNRRATWLVPLLIILATTVAYVMFLNSQTDEGWRQFMQDTMKQQSEKSGQPMPDAAGLAKGVSIGKLFTVAAFSLGGVIFYLLIAGVFALAFLLMQTKATFKKILSVVMWSACGTGIVQAVVAVASLLARDAESVRQIQPKNFGTVSATNLAVLLSSDGSPALLALASSLDIFSIWFLILLTIGFTTISGVRGMSTRKMGAVVFGLWLVGILLKVGSASVFGRR